jgi:hypothetical protein
MAKVERRAWLIALWSLSFVLVYGAGFTVVCITNIGPLLAKPETYGLAFMNAVLLVFMTNVFSEAGVLNDPWQKAGALFLGCLFFVGAYYNSVNGVSEGRDKAAGEKAAKIETIGSWDTQIEEWHKLDQKIPEHPPVTEEQYNTKLKARDDANTLRDAQCKESFIKLAFDRAKALQTCESLRTKAEAAQKEFDLISANWGYEKSHRDFIEKIAEATRKKKEEGPKPRYEEAAAGRLAPYLSRFGVTEAGLRDFMPLYYAALADLIFIFGSNLMMRRINRALEEAFGPGWWKRQEPGEVASVPAIIPPLSVEVTTVATIAERSPTVAPTHAETVAPIPATVFETIAPTPHETVAITQVVMPPRRETVAEWKNCRTHYRAGTETPAGTTYEWYGSYCRERGETPVTQTMFGREMARLGVKKNDDRSRPKYLDIVLKTPLRVVA